MGISITKRFGPYPFAHRQPKHDGHCRLIHGHNWHFDLTFQADRLDKNGFVVDFGQLGDLKCALARDFDHTLVLNADDPCLATLRNDLFPVANIVVVPNCGAEGLAAYIREYANQWLGISNDYAGRGVLCTRVTVFEDEKNSATDEARHE